MEIFVMKKEYSNPQTTVIVFKHRYALLSGSTQAEGLEGFGGNGGDSQGGKVADAHEGFDFDEY